MNQNPNFKHFDWQNGQLFEHDADGYHIKVHALVGENTFDFKANRSYYIYQYSGNCWINSTIPLLRNYYAVCNLEQNFIFGAPGAQALIIERIGTPAPFLMGGPVESKGRLKYIDGCTDSLLLAPWMKGEGCLNHLHFPTGIMQTMHTHPTIRIGIVKSGGGICHTPYGNIELLPGMLFAIMPGMEDWATGSEYGQHCFQTTDRHTMDVIAFHPDSDFGPTHEDHPMVNRTIVKGTAANQIPEIRTK